MLSWDLSPDISVFPEATQLLGLRALEWHCVSVSPSWVLDRVNGVAGKNRIEKTISNLSMRIFYMEGPEDLNICLIATSLMDITPSLGTRSTKKTWNTNPCQFSELSIVVRNCLTLVSKLNVCHE